MSRLPFLALLSILILSLSSCGGVDGPTAPPPGGGGVSSGDGGNTTGGGANPPAPVQPAGQQPQAGGNFLHDFPFDLVQSGGPGKDGIPALTDPSFVDASSGGAGYLLDSDLVLGVVINGEAKAYPHNIGWWHEIVNDVVGGQPVVVSLCPLTSTGMVFDGRGKDGSRITAGVSGLLFNSNLIMYDRRDGDTLYPQMISKGVSGPKTGDELTLMPVVETTWGYWKQLYPNAKVVSGVTGTYNTSQYRNYPYGGYRRANEGPFFPTFPAVEDNPTSRLFAPKEMTLGVRFGEIAKAYPFSVMGDEAVINDTVAGNPVVVAFYAREQLAIPYSPQVGTQTLTFEKVTSRDPVYPFLMVDKETGTTWDLKGEAIAGVLKGERLEQVPAHNAFWFAWATFWQKTEVYGR